MQALSAAHKDGRPNLHILGKDSVNMHSQHLHAAAYVVTIHPAGITLATGKHIIDGDMVANFNIGNFLTHLNHFSCSLVADDAGICGKRILSMEYVHIGTANSSSPNTNYCLTATRCFRHRLLSNLQFSGFVDLNYFHAKYPFTFMMVYTLN